MAVALDAISTAAATAATSVLTVSQTTMTVGAGANRALVALLTIFGGSSAPVLHWDAAGTNQLMQLIGTANSPSPVFSAYLFGLIAPTSGAKTLTATWTGASQAALDSIAFTGVDQTGGATSFPNFSHANGTGTAGAVTIITDTNNHVVGVLTGNGFVTGMDHTLIHNNNAAMAFGGNHSAGAADSVTLGGTLGASIPWVMIGTNIAAVGDVGTSSLSSQAAGFANSQPIFASFSPIWINTWVLDNGLSGLASNADSIYICSAQPADFTGATITFGLGSFSFGVGNVFGAPTNALPNGRVVTSGAISSGNVTASGTPTYWAAVDTANSRLLATGQLSGGGPVTNGNKFSLTAVSVHIPAL